MSPQSQSLPVIDVAPLFREGLDVDHSVEAIRRACSHSGFFYIRGHGVSDALQARLDSLSRDFFELEDEIKQEIRMSRGGRAWRGYFGVGEELTSGKPDQKEGLYFGSELSSDDPRVQAGTPLHGQNLFPSLTGFRDTVLEYLHAMTSLGHVLMEGIALSLQLDRHHFRTALTADPIILFRIFHYPPLAADMVASHWSVGEHTDYGLLTILKQDDAGGLQVKSQRDWIDARPLPGTFVCNIGDMLERMTNGLYRSTPHRVRNLSQRSRLSFPFFFDPGWDAEVRPVLNRVQSNSQVKSGSRVLPTGGHERWDGADLGELSGTYGEYLLKKVSNVFPDLSRREF